MILVIAWCLAAFVGAIFSALGLSEAVRDYLAIRPIYNGRRRLAIVAMAKMMIKFVITALWFAIGLYYAANTIEPQTSVASLVLVFTNFAVAALVILDYYERRKTLAELVRLRKVEAHQKENHD